VRYAPALRFDVPEGIRLSHHSPIRADDRSAFALTPVGDRKPERVDPISKSDRSVFDGLKLSVSSVIPPTAMRGGWLWTENKQNGYHKQCKVFHPATPFK
jgi:hypothetical protein